MHTDVPFINLFFWLSGGNAWYKGKVFFENLLRVCSTILKADVCDVWDLGRCWQFEKWIKQWGGECECKRSILSSVYASNINCSN